MLTYVVSHDCSTGVVVLVLASMIIINVHTRSRVTRSAT
jgi:hypothetical protein